MAFFVKLMSMERSDYALGTLSADDLDPNPLRQTQKWVDEASAAGAPEPTAMCIATATPDGVPSNRFVLLRGLDDESLRFYTNYESRKSGELDANPYIAATFWWPSLERQIRIEGEAHRTTPEESDAYFKSRPVDSQLASAASPQSKVVESREALEAMMAALAEQYPDGPPRPENWGGYKIVPVRIEFWQGRRARLHDRFRFDRTTDGWSVVRLAP